MEAFTLHEIKEGNLSVVDTANAYLGVMYKDHIERMDAEGTRKLVITIEFEEDHGMTVAHGCVDLKLPQTYPRHRMKRKLKIKNSDQGLLFDPDEDDESSVGPARPFRTIEGGKQ